MQQSLVELVLAGFTFLLLAADLFWRWRHRLGIIELSDMRGVLSFPLVAIIGGASSLYCGWLGWALLVMAALASGEATKIHAGHTSQLERAIVLRMFLLAELAVVAFSARMVVGDFQLLWV